MKLGCNILPPTHPALMARRWFGDYVERYALPPLETQLDWNLAVDIDEIWGNDTLGDCTCAGYANLVQAITGNCDGEIDPKLADVLRMYDVIGHGQDNGATLEDANNYMLSIGLAGVKLGSPVALNIQNLPQVQMGIQLFGGAYIACALPSNAQDLFTQGQVWDAVVNDGGHAGGHCMAVLGFNPQGPLFKTWAKMQQATWAWWLKYVMQAYACLFPAWIGSIGKSPSGFDYETLLADKAAI